MSLAVDDVVRDAVTFHDGTLVEGDVCSRSVLQRASATFQGPIPLIWADPWYGEVLPDVGDTCEAVTGVKSGTEEGERAFVDWMLGWTRLWSEPLAEGGAFYVWGGTGKPGFRPFFQYASRVERETGLTVAMPITWKKKRAYGVAHNYLFTREEVLYLIKGDPKKPRVFNVPLTDKARGYSGYDKRYPAKSELLRRSNVWTEDGGPSPSPNGDSDDVEYRMSDVWDETEILRGKRHVCEKPRRVCEIAIRAHTNPGERVLDLFSGSGGFPEAARGLGRAWTAVERSHADCVKIVEHMRA